MSDETERPRASVRFILPVEDGMVDLGEGHKMAEAALMSKFGALPGVFITKTDQGSIVMILEAEHEAWDRIRVAALGQRDPAGA